MGCSSEIAATFEDDQIASLLNWRYPFKESETLPSKLFVTQIRGDYEPDRKKLMIQIPEIVTQPDFVNPIPKLNPLQRGTAMHKVMQHIDMHKMDGSIKAIIDLVETLVEREIISPLEAETVDLEAIQVFINSPLGQRIKKAPQVYREAPFNLLCPAHEVLKGENSSDEQLLIQGESICLCENDGLVLVFINHRLTQYNQNNV